MQISPCGWSASCGTSSIRVEVVKVQQNVRGAPPARTSTKNKQSPPLILMSMIKRGWNRKNPLVMNTVLPLTITTIYPALQSSRMQSSFTFVGIEPCTIIRVSLLRAPTTAPYGSHLRCVIFEGFSPYNAITRGLQPLPFNHVSMQPVASETIKNLPA